MNVQNHASLTENGRTGTRESKKATRALVLSVVGIFLYGTLSVVGLIMGLQARKDIERSGGRLSGDGKANAAIIIGCFVILCYLINTVVYFAHRH